MMQENPDLENYVGRDDLLSRALGVPEYGGRVRGTGFGVTQKSYFGSQKRPTIVQLKEEISGYKQQLEQQMSGYKQDVEQKISRYENQMEQFNDHMRLLQEQNALLKSQIDVLMQSRPSQSPICDSTSARNSYPSTPKVPIPLVINFFFSLILCYVINLYTFIY